MSSYPTSHYLCPVDGCAWYHEDLGLQPPTVGADGSIRVVMASIDRALSAHLDGHAPVDYLRTIARLNSEVAALSGPRGTVTP